VAFSVVVFFDSFRIIDLNTLLFKIKIQVQPVLGGRGARGHESFFPLSLMNIHLHTTKSAIFPTEICEKTFSIYMKYL
jgi:hypothetical protein